jgi:hypothetical protein
VPGGPKRREVLMLLGNAVGALAALGLEGVSGLLHGAALTKLQMSSDVLR